MWIQQRGCISGHVCNVATPYLYMMHGQGKAIDWKLSNHYSETTQTLYAQIIVPNFWSAQYMKNHRKNYFRPHTHKHQLYPILHKSLRHMVIVYPFFNIYEILGVLDCEPSMFIMYVGLYISSDAGEICSGGELGNSVWSDVCYMNVRYWCYIVFLGYLHFRMC